MTVLDAWRNGHEEGMQLAIQQINKHCGTNFKTVAEAIIYIKKITGQTA